MKKQIVYASIIILEFILILHHFKKPTNYYSKIGLLFSIYIIMNSFDSYYIIANSSFILFVILYFYVNYNTRIKKSTKPLVEEEFTNKLRELKNINKLKSEESSLNTKKNDENNNNDNNNSNNSNNTNKKEKFSDTKSKMSLKDYRDSFNQYRFTRKVKGSIDALNKIPYYIEKFSEIWN